MAQAVPNAGQLRPLLHEEVDRLHEDDLQVLHRVALQLELERLGGELDAAFDEARLEGRLVRLPGMIKEARSALRSR
jgi:hypothetical protein